MGDDACGDANASKSGSDEPWTVQLDSSFPVFHHCRAAFFSALQLVDLVLHSLLLLSSWFHFVDRTIVLNTDDLTREKAVRAVEKHVGMAICEDLYQAQNHLLPGPTFGILGFGTLICAFWDSIRMCRLLIFVRPTNGHPLLSLGWQEVLLLPDWVWLWCWHLFWWWASPVKSRAVLVSSISNCAVRD